MVSMHRQWPLSVLVIGFRRPDCIRRVLEAVASSGADKVYVACDGPRHAVADEAEKVAAVKAVVEEFHECVHGRTCYQPTNLGCGRAVSAAVSWFLDQEGEGIILEDDCIPHPSFFAYCSDLLSRYRETTNVMQVSGYNPMPERTRSSTDYTFTNYGWQWGWATWRRAWQHFDLGMAGWPRFKEAGLHRGPTFPPERVRLLDATHAGKVDTWDYQWAFAMASQSGLSVVPRVNLVANVGFDAPGGTHFVAGGHAPRAQPPVEAITFPLRHPEFVVADPEYDRHMVESTKRPSVPVRALRRLRALMGRARS